MSPELEKNLKHLIRLGILVLTLVAIYLLFVWVFPIIGNVLSYIPGLIMPFIIAIIIAIIIEPIVSFAENKLYLNRGWATAFSLIVTVGGFNYLLFLVSSVIIKEMSSLYMLALEKSDQITSQVMSSIMDFRIFYLNLPPQVHATIEANLQKGLETLQKLMDNIIHTLLQTIAYLPNFFILIIIATVATFFIIRDRASLRRFIFWVIPSPARSTSRNIISQLITALIGFFKAYGILISITTIITLVSLKILGVQYVLTLGLIIGLMDILPILGPGTVFIPWIMWEFIIGDTNMGISLLIVYIIISVVRQILEPQIIGENIGLHPLATLISLYVGLQLGGLAGMIMGPVLVVIFIACFRAGLFDRFIWRHKI